MKGSSHQSTMGFGTASACAPIKRGKSEPAWREVSAELPEIGERVEVRGKYTPDGMGWPIAYRRRKDIVGITDFNAPCNFTWESAEWRGTVGVTHWRPIPKTKLENLKGNRDER